MKPFPYWIAELVASALGVAAEECRSLISAPPRPEQGDYAFPCFLPAKKLRQDPKKLAAELAAKIVLAGTPFRQVRAEGPYLNFRLDDVALAALTLTAIRDEAGSFGSSAEGGGRTVIVDYSSPNIAKPFHIGHLRSTVIGAALYRIYGARGFRPIGINHLGDWGTQFGMVMAAFDEQPRETREAELHAHPIAYSLKLYVEYNKKCEDDPAARETAKSWFKRLEDGEPEAVASWRRFRDLSLAEFERIYRRLGIAFDHYHGESFYNDKMEAALARARAAGAATRSEDGAEMVDLAADAMPPFILRKSDGATLYATRDLAAALYRFETFHPALILYVVGTPQELHFRQLVRTLELMGIAEADRIAHVKFGHVHGMSTRRGEIVMLEDVLDEAAAKAAEKIEENIRAGKLDPEVDRKSLAEAVGIGAIVAHDLKHRRERDLLFDWDQVLQFDGETGPYLQYSYARIQGILRKAGAVPVPAVDHALLVEPETRALILALSRFPEAVGQARRENEPSLVATCLFELTQAFNLFYTQQRVLGSGAGVEAARLALVAAAGQVIANGLLLLGIPLLERM
jgi:arginyl-tRNA synthetase